MITIGRKGSENGTILKDEEYNDLCRITLEKCSRYYAVTCGIYGELVHTAFADDGDIGSKGYEHKAKLTTLKEAARTLNYLTENNLLQYADLEKKVEDIHSSYARTGSELKNVEAKLREVQPLIKNISNYQRLKPVYDAYMKAADKPAYRAKHEAELVIYEAAKSTLLAIQGDGKLPSLKSLQGEQQRLVDEQQRLYDERAKLKKEARLIDTMKARVYLFPNLR